MNDGVFSYKELLENFLIGAIPVEEFQSIYLDRFKNEEQMDGPLFELLDALFGDVDSFTMDQQLLDEKPDFYLDEIQLRKKVQDVLHCLSILKEDRSGS